MERDGFRNVSGVDIDEEALRGLRAIADEKAVQRYRDILPEAKEMGLTVLLTLYHWPIPLWLHDPIACRDDVENADLRGWLDQQTIVEFAKYSAFAADALGDLFATINEPRIVSEHGYLSERGEFPPGLNDTELFLTSMKHLSLAHGVAYEQVKRWDTESMSDLGPASVGVVCVLQYYEPDDPSNALDVVASGFVEYVFNEWFLNSILPGDYDMNMDMVLKPEEHLSHIVNGCDFLGLNYYTRWRIRHAEMGVGYRFDFEFAPCTEGCTDTGYEVYSQGSRHVIDWAYRRCRRPIYVTENGVADTGDEMKERYLVEHIGQVHAAIHEDRVPIGGYFYWSLIDNLEWSDGYKVHFGLYWADQETKERTPTRAVPRYREITARNGL